MPVELITAPPAAGKTKYCIDSLQQVLKARPLSNAWVILPNRLQGQSFKLRTAEGGGQIGGRIGIFSDLYEYLLERTGSLAQLITGPLQHRLILQTVNTMFNSGRLPHFEPIRNTPGFILALKDSFSELKQAYVTPERMLEYAVGAYPATREIALLYQAYQELIDHYQWTDQEGQCWLAIAALEKNPAAAASIPLLVLDGFSSFTGAQRRFLQCISKQTEQVLITLLGQPASARPAQRRFNCEIEAVRRDLSARVTVLPGDPRLEGQIKVLERLIFEPGTKASEDKPAFLLEVRSQAEEAREALRWIKRMVLRDRVKISDCAIFASNMDTYQPLLRSAAAEFGIPVKFTRSEPLSESPAMLSLLNLLALPAGNFRARALLGSLRSPYFDFGMQKKDVEYLELISQKTLIVEGLEQWAEAWGLAQNGTEQIDDSPDEGQLLPGTDGLDLPALQAGFNQAVKNITPPAGNRILLDWIKWLEELLDVLKFDGNISSERDQQANKALGNALSALALSEQLTGGLPIDYSAFLSDLQAALDGAGLPDEILSDEDALLICSMEKASGVRFKAAALLGMAEGIFPAVENADPFLDEKLRRELGLEPRIGREQAGTFYQAITRADQLLLLTRPYLTDDGENWEPSPYWLAAEKLFHVEKGQRYRSGQDPALEEAASPQELLFWAAGHDNLPGKFDQLSENWKEVQLGGDVLTARRAKKPSGMFEGSTFSITGELQARYAPYVTWSASQLETYGTCPHWFFTGSALKLQPKQPPELGLNIAQIGSILHRVLEEVYHNVDREKGLDGVLGYLPIAAVKVFKDAPQEFAFRPSPLWRIEQAQFLVTLRKTITALDDASEGWTPAYYEQSYGRENTPVLEIRLQDETIKLRGIIDRIDESRNGRLRVLDYKTGGGHMDNKDLTSGRRLQLPIYALAVRDALKLGVPVDGIYWKINAAEPAALKLSTYKKNKEAQGIDAAYDMVKSHLQRMLPAIRKGTFPPQPPDDGCPSYCPAAAWCWRFKEAW